MPRDEEGRWFYGTPLQLLDAMQQLQSKVPDARLVKAPSTGNLAILRPTGEPGGVFDQWEYAGWVDLHEAEVHLLSEAPK